MLDRYRTFPAVMSYGIPLIYPFLQPEPHETVLIHVEHITFIGPLPSGYGLKACRKDMSHCEW